MLSRATILSGQQGRSLVAIASRATSATSTSVTSNPQDQSQVQGQRPVRQEPGKVRFGFVPDEWFNFFYKKTGVTGPYTFGLTFSTYLISKEIYVMEHEFYNGLSIVILWWAGIKLLGPKVAEYLDKEVDDFERTWNEGRVNEKQALEGAIADEQRTQASVEGQNLLVAAKRENVALQLEAAYRDRLIHVYSEVKKRLDYQIEKQNIERRLAQKNLVDWVIRKVKSSITPDQEKQNIDRCINDLAAFAKQ